MKPDMTLQELAGVVPKMMPEGLFLRKGEKVLVRFVRRNSSLYYATILEIFNSVTGEQMESVIPRRGAQLCIKVSVVGDEASRHPLWPFQDAIYTYEWVNDWAGMEVAKPPTGKVNHRLKKLFGSDV